MELAIKDVVVSVSSGLVLLAITLFVQARPKIIWANLYQFVHRLPAQDGETIAHTRTVLVQNVGRKTARDVEIVFNWQPQALSVWPQRAYEERVNPEGRHIIFFADLAPKEYSNIDVINIGSDAPECISVRCPDRMAKEVQTYHQILLPGWLRIGLQLVLFIGACTCIYFVLQMLRLVGISI